MNVDSDVAEVSFVAFDLETTGVNRQSDRIIEIGAVKFIGSQTLGEFVELVNPGIAIPPVATDISGITDAMVRNKPQIGEVIGSFLSFIGNSVLIAHNANFDLGFLRGVMPADSQLDNLIIDTLQLSRNAYPGQQSYSLQNLVAMLKLPTNNAHRALDDAIQCMRVFQASYRNLSFMGKISLKELLP